MKKNYISQFYSGFIFLLLCCLPLKGLSAEAVLMNTVNADYNSSYSLNFLSGNSSYSVLSFFNTEATNFGPRLQDGSFNQATSNNAFFGCSDIVMPTLSVQGSSIVASGMPYGYGDQVQFLWAENVNGRIEARTSWTTDPSELTFYPTSAGNYRLCAMKVGCSERSMRETPDIHYDAPCGTLTGVYIYDQTTDTSVYGPIVDGEEITISDLPANYYIVAETSGNIGSVNLTVNGESKLETIVPYTFPGGAQDGYNWNGGLGEHHVSVSAYKGNNTYSELCGTITVNFEIVVECNLTVEAEGEEICEGEEVTLTATATGEATCETCEDYGSYPVGTKIYKVSDSDPTCSIFDGSGSGIIFQCNNSNHYDVWKAGNDLYYLEFPNQTAKIIGTVYRGNYTAELEIDYYDFRENASSNWTARCYENNLGEFDNYHYNGTLKVNGGNTYSIYNSGDSAYANIGYGTSNDGNGYGIGAWPRGSIGNCSEMFGNFDLVCEVAEEQSEIQYLWSNGETTQSITVSPDETTTYTVTVKDCADCEAEKEVTVTVNEIPEVNVDDINICEGEAGTLTATGTDGVSYLWNTGDETASIDVTEAGEYSVTVTTADGCEAMDTAMVTITDPRSGTMTADATPICLDADSVQISATYNGDGNVPDGYVQLFVLTAGDDLVISGLDANPVFSVSEAGKYTIHSLVVPEGFAVPDGVTTGGEVAALLVENGGSVCASLDVPGAMIIVSPLPEVAVDDINICEGETGTLTATGTDGVSYLWNTGEETASIDVTEAGEYTVTVTTADGCEAMATAMATVTDPRSGTMTADATPICLDADSVQISATYNGDGNVPDGYVQLFVLTAGDDLVISGLDANPVFSVSEAGKYTIHSLVVPEGFAVPDGVTTGGEVAALLVENGGSVCASLDVPGAMIIVNAPQDDIVDEVTVCEGAEYVWDVNDTTYTAADSPVSITLTDDNGCEYTATLTINEYPATEDIVDEVTVCEGAEYVWDVNDTTYTAADSPVSITLTDDNGCEYTATLTINEYPATEDIVDEVTVCEGAEYVWDVNDTTYTAADSPVSITLTDDNGCEYTATLTINEYPATEDIVDEVTVCEGAEYVWDVNDTTYTAADSPVSITLTDDNGCEYTATLTINEYPATEDIVDEVTVCEGAEYVWDVNDTTYTAADSPVSITLTDDNGCEYTATLTINEYPATEDIVDEVTVCEGAEYVWDVNDTTYTAADSPVSITLTDDNGCEYTATLTINEYPATEDIVDEVTVCEGAEYVWDVNDTTYTAADSPVSITLTDDNGCEYTATLTINEYPATEDIVDEVTVCEGAEYVWDVNDTTYTAADSPVSITLTDDNGCEYTATLTINEYPATEDIVDEVTVCEGAEYVWDVNDTTYTAADSPVSITLTDDNGCEYTATLTINEYPATEDIVDEVTVCEGAEYVWDVNDTTYTAADSPVSITLTDDNGCEYTATLTINEYPATEDIVDEVTVCEGAEYVWDVNDTTYTAADSPVSITLTDDNGCEYTATLTINEYPATEDIVDEVTVCEGAEYVWDVNDTTYTAADSPVSITLTDDNGCEYTATLTINEYPATEDIVDEVTVCEGAEYVWDVNDTTYTAADSPVSITLTDDNGCEYTATLTINEYPATEDIVDEVTVCEGAEYVWDVNDTTYTAADSPVSITLTDDNGCEYTATLTINEYPATEDIVDEVTVCEGAEYVWDVNDTTYTAADSPVSITLTDDNGCEYTATLTINEYPATEDIVDEVTVCEGAEYVWDVNDTTYTAADSPVSITLTDDNGCEYTATLTINEYPATEDIVDEVTVCEGAEYVWDVNDTTYTAADSPVSITLTDDNGCEYTATLTINEYPATEDIVDEVTVCEGAEYVWDVNDTTYTAADSPVSITLTDDNGCEYTATLTINEYPATEDIVDEVTVCEGAEYVWDVNDTTYTAADSPVSITLTDDNGCEYTATLTINEYPATEDIVDEVTVCEGAEYVWDVNDTTYTAADSPVSITLTDDNGCEYTATLTINEYPATEDIVDEVTVCEGAEYVWDVNDTTYTAADSPVSITLTDDNGCEYTATLTINEYPATEDIVDEVTVCEGAEYVWDVNDTTYTAADSPVSITLTDDNGCEYTATLTINEQDPTTVDAGDDETICEGDEVTLTATGNGTFMWFVDGSDDMIGMEASLTVSPEASTTYRVKVTTEDGCEAEDTVTVTVNDKVIIGDFVWEDTNENGLQDDGEPGVFGVTVELYQCIDGVNDGGVLVDSMLTNRFGLYQFEVCPNSGSYYIVFSDIPDGFEFTSQDSESDDSINSDADAGGVTECFEIFEEDDLTRDAGIINVDTCGAQLANKILPRDPPGIYQPRSADTACIGDDLYFWVFRDITQLQQYIDEDFTGWTFTFTFPNGDVFVQDSDNTALPHRIANLGLGEEDFGVYTVDYEDPNGCMSSYSFTLSLGGECLEDGTRPSDLDSREVQLSPNPATTGGVVNIAVNTRNGSITTATNGTLLQARNFTASTVTINVALYDMSGRLVATARPYQVNAGRAVINYQLGGLETGTYMVQVIGDGWNDTAKLIVK